MRCVVIVILLLSSAAFYANAAEDRIVEFVTKAGTAEIAGHDAFIPKGGYAALRSLIERERDKDIQKKVLLLIGVKLLSDDKVLREPDVALLIGSIYLLACDDSIRKDAWRFLKAIERDVFPANVERYAMERFAKTPSVEFALLLGRCGSEESMRILRESAKIENDEVRCAVMLALARRGDSDMEKAALLEIKRGYEENVALRAKWRAQAVPSKQPPFLFSQNICNLEYIGDADSLMFQLSTLVHSEDKGWHCSDVGAYPDWLEVAGVIREYMKVFNINIAIPPSSSQKKMIAWWERYKDDIKNALSEEEGNLSIAIALWYLKCVVSNNLKDLKRNATSCDLILE